MESHGWSIADSETQGLAGDDIFARDPHGVWWSIEVKNTNSFQNKFVHQAKRQAQERRQSIHEVMNHTDKLKSDYFAFSGIEQYDPSKWLVMWHPSNCGSRGDMWVVATNGDKNYTRFLAPFIGEV